MSSIAHTESQRRVEVARHEAGHCVAAHLLGIRLHAVSLVPVPGVSKGHVDFERPRGAAHKEMVLAAAGAAAVSQGKPGFCFTSADAAVFDRRLDAMRPEERHPAFRAACEHALGLVGHYRADVEALAERLLALVEVDGAWVHDFLDRRGVS